MLHILVREREIAIGTGVPVWSQTANNKGVNVLESREARIGTAVGVLDRARRPEKGHVGTIEQTFGHPDYLAVDVLFEDGSLELYWFHELRKMEQPPLA